MQVVARHDHLIRSGHPKDCERFGMCLKRPATSDHRVLPADLKSEAMLRTKQYAEVRENGSRLVFLASLGRKLFLAWACSALLAMLALLQTVEDNLHGPNSAAV